MNLKKLIYIYIEGAGDQQQSVSAPSERGETSRRHATGFCPTRIVTAPSPYAALS